MEARPLPHTRKRDNPKLGTNSWWRFLVTTEVLSTQIEWAFTHSEKVSMKANKYVYPIAMGLISVNQLPNVL